MKHHRRHFLRSFTGATVGTTLLRSDDSAARNGFRSAQAAATDPSPDKAPLDVILCFDVEDIFSPPEVGNDDSIKDLATILTEEGLRGTFFFIGDRAEHLGGRGRGDVIASLKPHEVALHTRSARHPTVSEYVAGKSWKEAVGETLEREQEGVEIIERVFDSGCVALSSHNVYDTPHATEVAARLGLPYVYGYPAAPPLYSLSWYAGALNFPYRSPTLANEPFRAYFEVDDSSYDQPEKFQEGLKQLDQHIKICRAEGQPFFTLFLYHPQRLRLIDFVDFFWCPNGANLPKERWGELGWPRRRSSEGVKTALDNFRRLAQWIRRDTRLNPVGVADVCKKYGEQLHDIALEELVEIASAISGSEEILMHARLSPAEVALALSRAIVFHSRHGRLPSRIPRDDVLGPISSPIWYPEMRGCSLPVLVRLASRLIDEYKQTGHLSAKFGSPFERVGVNHLYRALAEVLLAHHSKSHLEQVEFIRMMPYPRLASPIGIRYLRSVEGGLMNPDTDVNTVYRDGKLQTWTLKPAQFS